MKLLSPLVMILVIFYAAQVTADSDNDMRARFIAKDGRVIAFDAHNKSFISPYGKRTSLGNCSNTFETCVSDGNGFAFAFFKHCDMWSSSSYKKLSFKPKIISSLHDDLWLVFDKSPSFMFHYSLVNGLVGIYSRKSPGFDFRIILRDKNFPMAELDVDEFALEGTEHIAKCSDPSDNKG